MRTTRKIITFIAVLALLFTSVMPAFAAQFSDLEGHWAKEYMEKLVERGIINGYSDGTIRPEGKVTAAETFVMLANLYSLNDAAKKEIVKDYGPTVEKVCDAKYKWAFDYISICMAAGIVTESELKNIKLGSPVYKQDLAVYMVRAIKRTDDAAKLTSADLKYKDLAEISAKCLGSVALLTDMGVVSGDDQGNFVPRSEVSRAVFSTMLCNILEKYLEKESIKLKIDSYMGLQTVEGYLTSVSNTAVIVRGANGIYRSYPRDTQMKSTVNGSAKELSASYEGDAIKLQLDEEGKAVTAAVTEDANVTYKQGRISLLAANTISAKITDLRTEENGSYVLMEAKITEDGKEAAFSDLDKGSFLTMKLEKGVAKEAAADTKEYTVSGTVGTLRYDTIVTMTVKEKNEADAVLYMDLADMPVIKRGALSITVDRLSEGEAVKVTIKGGEVTRIETQGKDASMTGQLIIITRTIKDTTWTIKGTDGSSATYTLDSAAAAYRDNTAIKLDAINPGDEVSVTVTAGVITEVSLKQSATPAADKLSAQILAIDANNRVLTVLKESKLIYINCKKAASILDSETGKTINFSSLAAGDRIVAYGSFADSSNFDATSIVIELKH